MAYGVKYRFQWADDAGATWKVDISKDGYSGSVLMRSVGGSSAVLRRDRNGNICGTSLELAAECVVDEEFAELYTTDPFEFKVEVFCGNTSMWVGFVTPELYSEPFIAPPYDVEVTASDNLGELKRYKWAAVGRQTIASLLSTLLEPTGLTLNQRYVSKLATSTVVASAFFTTVTLDLDELAGETYYDVLDNLLNTFHAVIFQQGGCWCIMRETDVEDSISSGSVLPAGQNSGYAIASVGSAYAGGLWPEGHVDLTVEPAYNGISLVCQELWGRYGTASINNSPSSGGATMSLVAEFSASDAISLHTGTNVERFPLSVIWDSARHYRFSRSTRVYYDVVIKVTGNGVSRYLDENDDQEHVDGEYVWTSDSSASIRITPDSKVWYRPAGRGMSETTTGDIMTIEFPDCADITALTKIEVSMESNTQADGSGRTTNYIPTIHFYDAWVSFAEQFNSTMDTIAITNNARGPANDVKLVVSGLTDVGIEKYFITNSLLINGALIGDIHTDNFSGQDFISLLSRDYALSIAAPRLRANGTLFGINSPSILPLFLTMGGVKYTMETWDWNLISGGVNFSALSMPAASITVASETITTGDNLSNVAGSSSGSSGGSSGGGSGFVPSGSGSSGPSEFYIGTTKGQQSPTEGQDLTGIGKIYMPNDAVIEVVNIGTEVSPKYALHTNIGFYSDSFVSAGGLSDAGGGGGGTDLTAVWNSLATNSPSDVGYNRQIDVAHLSDALSGYQPLDADLTSIAGLSGTSGLLKKTAANTWTLDTSTYLTTSAASSTYQPLDADLTSIAGLSGTSGLLKKTAANTWTLDTSTYLTSNQTITLSGDVSGSGKTSISVSIGSGKVTNAMLAGSIANSKLSNSAITINGSSTSLGGSFSTASITAGTAGTSSATSGLSISIPYVTLNAYGITTAYGTHTHTISAANITSAIGSTTYAPYNADGYLPLSGGNLTGFLVFDNAKDIQVKDSGGTALTVMGLNASNIFHIGYGPSGAGYTTNLEGNEINLKYSTSRTIGLTLTSAGNVVLANHLYLANDNQIRFRDTNGNVVQVFQFNSTNRCQIGYGAAINGYDTYINGNNIVFRYGTTPTIGLTLESSGRLVVGNTSVGSIAMARTAANYIWATGTGGTLLFGVADKGSTGTANSRMAINQYGVGINGASTYTTASSTYALNVTGAIHATTGIVSDSYVSAGGVSSSSDARLKTDLKNIGLTVDQIAEAPAVTFRWKNETTSPRHAGSIAQYWETVLPETVSEIANHLALDYGATALLSAITVAKEVQRLRDRIKELEDKVYALE